LRAAVTIVSFPFPAPPLQSSHLRAAWGRKHSERSGRPHPFAGCRNVLRPASLPQATHRL